MGLAVGIEYPAFQEVAQALVLAHSRLPDERLLFAAYYAPPGRDRNDIFVFEILEGFGANAIDEERCFLEVTYGSSAALPFAPDQRLHLVLTSPAEFERAVRERWDHLVELQVAVQHNEFQKLYPPEETPWERMLHG